MNALSLNKSICKMHKFKCMHTLYSVDIGIVYYVFFTHTFDTECIVCIFPAEVLLDPCRTWCPSSSCQAVCQLKEEDAQEAQPVQCPQCSLRFCSACRADCHTDQGCPEGLPITTFLPGENRYIL